MTAPAAVHAGTAGDVTHFLVDVDPYDDGSSAGVIPTYDWGSVPVDVLATRRQLRAAGRRPGGHDPVAQLKCRRCSLHPSRECIHKAWLYRVDLTLPKITMTPAKEEALDAAMAARQTCPECKRRFYNCPSTRLGMCLECHDGTPVDPASVMFGPTSSHGLAA